MIQTLRPKYALSLLLEIAQLPRATFYYHLKRMQKADKYAQEKAEIAAIYHENKGRYGYRRITMALHSRGFLLNHKTVQRLMRELGLVCRVRIKKYRSYKGEAGKIAPNLLNRNFRAEKPNQMGHRCDGVQFVWPEAISLADFGFTQWLSDQLYDF